MACRNFYPRSPCGERRCPCYVPHRIWLISIHALLAESDFASAGWLQVVYYFYPRSPCGERRLFSSVYLGYMKNFYPRSPCGERQRAENHANSQQEFLSTLSLRRATDGTQRNGQKNHISIHALLAESDGVAPQGCYTLWEDFYPRSPCGERHQANAVDQILPGHISIHALLAESDCMVCI